MTHPIERRRRSIGLTCGALWLIAASAFVIVWSLIAIDTRLAKQMLIVAVAVVALLTALGGLTLRAALHLPVNDSRSPDIGRMVRWFYRVFAAEIGAFALMNPLLVRTRHFDAMPSANLIIVGLHFIPLAWIFRIPRYYFLGLLFCGIPLATLLAVPHGNMVAHALGRYVLPTIGCGVTALVISAANLREAWRLVQDEVFAIARDAVEPNAIHG